MNNQPKQYQQGWTEFYKLRFKLTPDVLIPRPETELLVDQVLQTLKENPDYTVLDLGTGSGNIAISIVKNLPKTPTPGVGYQIIATDISQDALKIAQLNAKFHKVKDKIKFIQSNLLDFSSHQPYPLSHIPDIIVTNLPYIPSQRIPYLDSSVRDFEPKVALDGGEDGFELYRKLFKQIKQKGWKPKLILGEIDYTHGELAVRETLKIFPQAQVEVKTDLAHKQRILIVKF